jgi:hypothetical protein
MKSVLRWLAVGGTGPAGRGGGSCLNCTDHDVHYRVDGLWIDMKLSCIDFHRTFGGFILLSWI